MTNYNAKQDADHIWAVGVKLVFKAFMLFLVVATIAIGAFGAFMYYALQPDAYDPVFRANHLEYCQHVAPDNARCYPHS